MIAGRAPYLKLLMVWIVLFLPVAGNAQLGIVWDPPPENAAAQEQLRLFIRSGISVIEVPAGYDIPYSPADSGKVQYWIRGGKEYLTFKEIREQQKEIRAQVTSMLSEYRNNAAVSHIGVIRQSHTQHPMSKPVFDDIREQLLQDDLSIVLYETRRQEFLSVSDTSRLAYVLDQGNYERSDLIAFSDSLDAFLDRSEIMFIRGDWYLDAAEDFQELPLQLDLRLQNESAFLALPEITKESPAFDAGVLLLILLWGTVAVLIVYYPTYRPMLVRYFGAHSFYVDDIIQYRERAAASGVVLVSIHAVCGALIYSIGFTELLSPQSGSALFHHAPALTVFGDTTASIFADAFVLILLVELIALAWLYLPNRELTHFSQVINLYSWIFHVDIILATLTVTFAASGASTFWILSAVLIYTLIWFLAFNIGAIDASRALSNGKNLYLILTIGLHSIISITLVVLVFVLAEVRSVIELIGFLSS